MLISYISASVFLCSSSAVFPLLTVYRKLWTNNPAFCMQITLNFVASVISSYACLSGFRFLHHISLNVVTQLLSQIKQDLGLQRRFCSGRTAFQVCCRSLSKSSRDGIGAHVQMQCKNGVHHLHSLYCKALMGQVKTMDRITEF